MKKAPLQRVKEEFGGKDKLVAAIVDVIDRGEEDKEDLRKRLLAASNTKLLRLLETAKKVKESGGKEKLVDAVAKLQGRTKDGDYKGRLQRYSAARLLDLHTGLERRQRASAAPKKKGRAA